MGQRILIVDDDDAVRDSLRMMLESAGHVVTDYGSARQVLADADFNGGCLIADIRMPGMSGLELQEELVRRQVPIPVIIITGHGDVPLAVQAMKAGAVDFIEKPFDDTAMLESVARALLIGQHKQSRSAQAKAARDLLDLLTPREHDVLDELVKGSSNKIVAHELGISARTVEIHRANIMDKIRARSLSDLVRTALEAQSGATSM